MHTIDVRGEPITIPARDGYFLSATLRLPAGPMRRAVLIAPATGVPRRIYDELAAYLAGHGMAVVSWDWRGIAGSRPPEGLRGFEATMSDWATLDLAGVIDWAAQRFGDRPLAVIGHSFGGQAIGLAPGAERLERLVLLAAQSGYWGHWPWPRQFRMAALWHLWIPLLARIFGYLPGWTGIGHDLPQGVAREWASWGRSPRYLGDYRGHARLEAPLLALSFSDDDYAPRKAVNALLNEYGGRHKEHWHFSPAQLGASRVGHFGFLRADLATEVWARMVRWLDREPAPLAMTVRTPRAAVEAI